MILIGCDIMRVVYRKRVSSTFSHIFPHFPHFPHFHTFFHIFHIFTHFSTFSHIFPHFSTFSTFFTFFHIFTHFSTFFHIFTHFSTFFHPYHYISQTVAANYTVVKRKWGIPKTLLMDTLILNLKPFVSESSKKAVPQNIFPKLLYPQNILQKLSLQKILKKDKITRAGTPKSRSLFSRKRGDTSQCGSWCAKLSSTIASRGFIPNAKL